MVPLATASRFVSALSPTSTMRAFPCSSKWVNSIVPFRPSYIPFPNPQLGYVHTGQLRHSPPCPRAARSSGVTGSSAITLGSTRSKMVRLAYITQPGRPMTATVRSPAS